MNDYDSYYDSSKEHHIHTYDSPWKPICFQLFNYHNKISIHLRILE